MVSFSEILIRLTSFYMIVNLIKSIPKRWNKYNLKCIEGVEDLAQSGEIIRMNTNYLFTFLCLFPFMGLDLYFGVYNLFVVKVLLASSNVLFIYLSSTRKYKYLSHYLMSGVAMSSTCYSDNYLGADAMAFLFYYSPLIEFTVSYLVKKLSVVLINTGSTILFMLISIYYDHSLFLNPDISPDYITTVRWISYITLVYAILFQVTGAMDVRKRYEKLLKFENDQLQEKEEASRNMAIKLEMQNMDAELRLLKNQLNPHFIFNTLETVKILYKSDVSRGNEYIEKLSDFLRVNFSNESGIESVANELISFRNFVDIQSVRFFEKIHYTISVSDEAQQHKLPYFTLATLAENAMKHNIFTKEKPLYLKIYSDADSLYVSNNIQLRKSKVNSNGIGLKNLSERYRLLYSSELDIHKTESEFIAKLKLIK